jgi:putative membrane protein
MLNVQDFKGLLLFGVYLSTSVAMLITFTWLYLRITPYDEAAELSKGNMAPAIALAGAMLGFTFPLLVASYTHSNIIGFLAWGMLSCVVQLLAFLVMYWLHRA